MSIYAIAVETFAPMLESLSMILDKAVAHCRATALDSATLSEARLAPDMYPLTRQVQIACDAASDTVARLAGKDVPTFANDECTIEDLKARIATTLETLKRVHASDFDGAETRVITIPLPNDGGRFEMRGVEFLRDWGLPHFYFHVVTAYDILRNQGLEIGKRDYLSHVGRYFKAGT